MAFELIKVSELPELTTPSDPNVIPIQDGDYLKRISFENLKKTAVGDMEGSLAAAYDSTATYAVGDYCIYEGQLYRCTTAITTAEAWTSGHWTAAVLTDDIASDLSAEASTRSTNDNALAADIAEALGDLAAVYSTSATYAVGDYCTKDGQLYRCTTAITTAEAWTAAHWSAVALGDDTRDLRSALTYEETVTNSGSVSASGYTVGLMTTDGTVLTGGSYDNYKYSSKISVQQGDVFRGVTFRFVTAFSNGSAISEKGGNSVSTYTVPEGIDEVVVSVASSVSSFTYDYTRTTLLPKNTAFPLDKNILSKTGTFTSGGLYNYILMTQAKSSLSKNFLAVFECDCVSGTDFEFGFTVSNSTPVSVHNNVISISSQNISYDGVDYAHGITIEGRIKLIVEQLSTAQAKITLMANGVAFVQTIDYVLTTTCSPYVRSIDLIANNCKLTFTCADLQKLIWIFGDSYMSYSDNRWRYYLHSYGYDENALINAHSGAGSVNAVTALTNLLAIGKPKYIIWAIGMNDGSDTNASTPASSWITGRDTLLGLCDENIITPVFCTIPNVPTVSNAGKNAWIKASGYKYIDLCHAVGADETTSWLGTMLSQDGVHPSVTGAKALFAQVLADFPEITIEN